MAAPRTNPALERLLKRLKTYVVDWKFSFVPSDIPDYEPGIDREEADLDKANIVSSETRPLWGKHEMQRHAVLLDIDYPAYLVESSTCGHSHLYLDVPGGVKHEDYMELLALLGRIGVIEKGYAEVSIKRGHSDLRLPWVTKAQQKRHNPDDPGIDMSPGRVEGETATPLRATWEDLIDSVPHKVAADADLFPF